MPTPLLPDSIDGVAGLPLRADIFCRVVDNFGDIGVCWRLARRLARDLGWSVRLWVDNLASFQRLEARIDVGSPSQSIDDIQIIEWTAQPPKLTPRDVVIEAFACDPPAEFVAAMAASRPLWINLEYLSAESWVQSCHGRGSMRADGLKKFFFFPGFSDGTGGLLREPGLLDERDAFQNDPEQQRAFLTRINVDSDARALWQRGARIVSLFCYPSAPVDALLEALARNDRPTLLLVPEGVAPDLVSGRTPEHPRLTVQRIPFLSSSDYDRLLWCADLNFVRGEDSFVRAMWAGRPMVWQIYPQQQAAHLEKLEAWLALFPAPLSTLALIRAWNAEPGADRDGQTPQLIREALGGCGDAIWKTVSKQFAADQAEWPDLADSLADFCAKNVNNS
jgi:uncharacterized repeat protein (TIGR03837 family)